MGTTVTCALIYGGDMYIGHAGDSRAYILRDGELVQLTNDHSYIAELVRLGQLTPEEAYNHPHKNIITRALGTDSSIRTDTEKVRLKKGDIVVLCSDGLTNHVHDQQIENVLKSGKAVEDMAALLLNGALGNGGLDNISIIVAVVEDGDVA
jgi:protein phosphatase